MLHVMAVIPVQTEHLPAACAALKTLAAQSRTEAGCVSYEVFQRMGEAVLVTQECWGDSASEAAHMSGPHVAAALGAIGSLLAGAPQIHHYSKLA